MGKPLLSYDVMIQCGYRFRFLGPDQFEWQGPGMQWIAQRESSERSCRMEASSHCHAYGVPPKPDDPEGWRVVEFRRPRKGESFIAMGDDLTYSGILTGDDLYSYDTELFNGRRWIAKRAELRGVDYLTHLAETEGPGCVFEFEGERYAIEPRRGIIRNSLTCLTDDRLPAYYGENTRAWQRALSMFGDVLDHISPSTVKILLPGIKKGGAR